jgi:hypothetical protein
MVAVETDNPAPSQPAPMAGDMQQAQTPLSQSYVPGPGPNPKPPRSKGPLIILGVIIILALIGVAYYYSANHRGAAAVTTTVAVVNNGVPGNKLGTPTLAVSESRAVQAGGM